MKHVSLKNGVSLGDKGRGGRRKRGVAVPPYYYIDWSERKGRKGRRRWRLIFSWSRLLRLLERRESGERKRADLTDAADLLEEGER